MHLLERGYAIRALQELLEAPRHANDHDLYARANRRGHGRAQSGSQALIDTCSLTLLELGCKAQPITPAAKQRNRTNPLDCKPPEHHQQQTQCGLGCRQYDLQQYPCYAHEFERR